MIIPKSGRRTSHKRPLTGSCNKRLNVGQSRVGPSQVVRQTLLRTSDLPGTRVKLLHTTCVVLEGRRHIVQIHRYLSITVFSCIRAGPELQVIPGLQGKNRLSAQSRTRCLASDWGQNVHSNNTRGSYYLPLFREAGGVRCHGSRWKHPSHLDARRASGGLGGPASQRRKAERARYLVLRVDIHTSRAQAGPGLGFPPPDAGLSCSSPPRPQPHHRWPNCH